MKVVPWDYNLMAEDESSYHGVFISNGPGDPSMLQDHTVRNLSQLLRREEAKDKPKPIFGICIGASFICASMDAVNAYLTCEQEVN